MKSNSDFYIVAAILAIAALTAYLLKDGLSGYKKDVKENVKKDNKFDNEIKIKLQEIKNSFLKQAIGFYLQEKAFENNLSRNEKDKLFTKTGYKEEFSSPAIDWSGEFDFMKDSISYRNEFIKKYLTEKAGEDFCKEGGLVLNCFERYLLDKAKRKADKVYYEKIDDIKNIK